MHRRSPEHAAHWLLVPLVALAVSCAPAAENDADAAPPSEAAETTAVQQPPPADPADVASAEAIVYAAYDVISGEAGEARDWERWRSLFLPQSRLHPVGRDGEAWMVATMTPDQFAEGADSSFIANGFYEEEIGEVTETYGNIAHRFSSYASYRSESDTVPFNRGINSFQLMNDGERWWILSILWQHEVDGGPIPDRYLANP